MPGERKGKLRLDNAEGCARAGGVGQRGDRAGQARRKRALPADHRRRPRRADAAAQDRQNTLGRRDRQAQDLDRRGGRVSRALGVRPAAPAGRSRRSRTPAGAATRSTASSWPGSKPRGSRPSPEADKVTLIRRLSLDLIGLPPTIEEVDAFLADSRDDAYEKAGRAAARLAPLRRALGPALARRRALCRLATATRRTSRGRSASTATGSSAPSTATCPTTSSSSSRSPATCCPAPTQDQIVATGFLRNSMINEEGGIDPEQFRMEAMFDRMDCIGKGVLGLTIQCAQCHNHKYDPLTQEEYYRMFAFLNNATRRTSRSTRPTSRRRRAEIFREIRDDRGLTQAPASRLGGSGWPRGRSRSRDDQPAWTIVRPEVEEESTGGEKYYSLDDGSFLAQGYAPTKHTVEMSVKTDVDADHGVSAGAAQRSRTCRWAARAGRSRGRRASPSSGSRPRRPTAPSKTDRGEVRAGHGRRQSARDAARADLRRQERQEASDRPDRLRHRRQGRDRLGHRRRPGPAQPAAQGGLHGREADRVSTAARS